MAALNGSKEVTEKDTHANISHSEFGSQRRGNLVVHVEYDKEGLGGIIRSPYVFGAALLASFGGFSFGYGTFTMR